MAEWKLFKDNIVNIQDFDGTQSAKFSFMFCSWWAKTEL